MKILFIQPSIGKKEGKKYLKTWQMEALSIAQLSGLTPKNIKKNFFDERIEDIDFSQKADIVAITVETYTARRAYQIADEFKNNGSLIVMGGLHATLMTEEVAQHADAVIVGEAEDVWEKMLDDAANKKLQKIYRSEKRPNLSGHKPDRTIYNGKKYLPISLVETGRGCKFRCNFCSVSAFYNQSYNPRPIDDVISEIKGLKNKILFLVDDNMGADPVRMKKFLEKLIPLKIKWVSQISINVLSDETTLDLLKRSGCFGVLIGFESIDKDNLKQIGKDPNKALGYEKVLAKVRDKGLSIYATFVFGYDNDNPELFEKTYQFAMRQKFFLTAFNHLMPFPGTPLYSQLEKEGRLLYDKWWLSSDYSFGDLAFRPKTISPQEIAEGCYKLRKRFYSVGSIIERIDPKTNFRNPFNAVIYIWLSLLFRKEVSERKGLPLGKK
jgi:radical SAM superfamily enzyme YgiQ (UPF0313 family)